MFSKSLDNKQKYLIDDNIEVVDLSDSIFDKNYAMSQVCSMYKVRKEYEMRPDLISKVIYGSTDYTEMILKYSMVNNPFAIEKDDLIYAVTLSNIYNPIKENSKDDSGVFEAVKNYHKYIDKNKVPSQPGSDPIKTNTIGTEANISKTGNNGINIKNGKIYFGSIDESLTTVDSSIVDCATSGVSLGEFLNAAIRSKQ